MKRGYVFTIVFIFVVSVVFATVLAVANELARPAMEANARLAEQSALLYAFNLPTDGGREELEARFAEQIELVEGNDLRYYVCREDGVVQAYAVPIDGSALWGAVRGYLALSPTLDTIEGLVFTEQNETPGLGGRIDEAAYKEQFRGVPLGKEVAYGAGLDAITGATQTSNAIIRIVNDALQQDVQKLEEIVYAG